MIHVVSFSGGRTSAYLVHLMEQKRKLEGWDVKYLFMDTGAEHPKTYEFVRNVVNHFGIDLVCLRTKFNPELGKANSFDVINLEDCTNDLKPWKDMLSKYGTPYNPGGAFCTDRMKLVPFKKYCDQNFGKGNYKTWLGIRADEPKRLKPREDAEYLASISDFEKEDILDWWKEQPFDLDIPEHLGNCVFCIKKGLNKVALAAKDEPDLAIQFTEILESDRVRVVEQRKSPSLEMYRGKNSLTTVIKSYDQISRDELAASLRGAKRFESGSCSESCEVFNDESISTDEMKQEIEEDNSHFVNKSSTPEAEKDCWKTPKPLFDALNTEFSFTLDVCADEGNALCDHYFTAENSAINNQWLAKAAFMNPPYSQTQQFINKAAEQAKLMNLTVVALVNANTDTQWFAEAAKTANEIRLLTGRVGFVRADGKKANGNTKGQCLIVWRGRCETPCVITMVDRKELEKKGLQK